MAQKIDRSPAIQSDSLPISDCASNLDGHVVSPKWSAQLDSLNQGANLFDHFSGNGDAFRTGALRRVGLAHPIHVFIRDWNTKLVHHKLCIAVTSERPD